jgi:hypothetical protein
MKDLNNLRMAIVLLVLLVMLVMAYAASVDNKLGKMEETVITDLEEQVATLAKALATVQDEQENLWDSVHANEEDLAYVENRTDYLMETTEVLLEHVHTKTAAEEETQLVEAAPPTGPETVTECVSTDEENYVLRVLTAEAGHDLRLCYAVAQCLYNSCEKEGWRYTPAEIMRKYKYTSPSSWVSDEARQAYRDVFVYQERVYPLYEEKALYFYAPRYVSGTPWHESQRFVCEINGVRFFGEVQG